MKDLLADLDRARRAYAEVEVAEMAARNASLRARLEGGESVTGSRHWAEIDAEQFTTDKIRLRCEVQRLEDLRDMHWYGHADK